MTETERLLSHVEDKLRLCEQNYMVTNTRFLNLGERSEVQNHIKKIYPNHIFYGGYDDAERTALFLLPDYMEREPFPLAEEDIPFCVLSCRASAGKALTHRDYLGSLLALGLERDVVGDILVSESGAEIIVMKSIAEYLLANYEKVGSVPVKTKLEPIGNLIPPKKNTKWVRESVASVRLDNMLSAVFGVSRSDAVSAIAHGLVFVNDTEMKKADARINEGDKLVLRGKGKAYFRELGSTTRRGRLSVLFEVYQ